MTGVLYRIAQFCVRRRFIVVLGVWLVVAVALVGDLAPDGRQHQRQPVAAGHQQPARDRHAAEVVPDAGQRHEPDRPARPKSGKLTDSKYANAVNTAAADLAKQPEVASVINPLTPAGRVGAQQGQGDRLPHGRAEGQPRLALRAAMRRSIIDAAAKPAEAAGLEVQTGGQLGQKVSKPATESSELIGIIAAMIILTFTFGTVTAMLLPIITAIFALAHDARRSSACSATC